MSKKDERYLNVTIKNDEAEKDEVVISFSTIFKKLKKYLTVWLVLAIVVAALMTGFLTLFKSTTKTPLKALVSFTYSGVEKGLDPAGNKFDANTLKSPAVIEDALTELGHPLAELEEVRRGIKISGIIPPDAVDRLTAYKSVHENSTNGSISAVQAMLETEYYPTQYQITFDYSNTSLSSSEAVLVFNTTLDCYRDYFFENYGYNAALGSAVTSIDYNDYDYAEAIDMFDSTLTTLRTYVNNIAIEDTTRFRSNTTGYTFADLSETIKTLKSTDLDMISSYVTVNNVTKDKDTLVAYYEYRIDSLTRSKTIYEEELASLTESINSYVKDNIIIFGNGTDDTNTQYTQASEQYDKLIEHKRVAQNNLSTTKQQITYYNDRITSLKRNKVGSTDKIEKVEADLVKLNEKINELVEAINLTADEYYENVAFANAYNVLVPASNSVSSSFKNAIKAAMMPLLLLEALLFVAYFGYSFIKALAEENKKKAVLASDDEDNEDAAEDNQDEAVKEEAEKTESEKKSKK